jgi:hypothetical protein
MEPLPAEGVAVLQEINKYSPKMAQINVDKVIPSKLQLLDGAHLCADADKYTSFVRHLSLRGEAALPFSPRAARTQAAGCAVSIY